MGRIGRISISEGSGKVAIDDANEGQAEVRAPAIGPARHLKNLKAESQYRAETRNLSREERQKYGNFLWNLVRMNLGPPVAIGDLVGSNQDSRLSLANEQGLDSSVNFYQARGDPAELVRVLKFFTAYLLHQARKEDLPEQQEFLLYKAADLARMIVQYSPMAASGMAEAIVFNIYIALGTDQPAAYANLMGREENVHALMRRVETMPQDTPLRLELADQLLAQESFIDALVQYRMLLRLLAMRGSASVRSRSWVVCRLGDLFQRVADIPEGNLRDGRKLKTFVDRFNRDIAEKGNTLPPFQAPTRAQVVRVRMALQAEANRWHLQAVASPLLEPRRRVGIVARAGDNFMEMGQYGQALQVLQDAYGLWVGVEDTQKTLEEKLAYLGRISTAASQLKNPETATWANRAMNETNGRLSAIVKKKKEHEAARAALLA